MERSKICLPILHLPLPKNYNRGSRFTRSGVPSFLRFSRSFFYSGRRGIAWRPLKITYFRGQGRFFFLEAEAPRTHWPREKDRQRRDERKRSQESRKERKWEKERGSVLVSPSARLVLFHRPHPLFVPFSLWSPALLEAGCNNGCPLIIERPRHFKEIPGEPITGTPFRSLLKISSLLLPSCPSHLPSSSGARVDARSPRSQARRRERGNDKNNERRDRASWKIGFVSRDGTYRTVRPLSARIIIPPLFLLGGS